MWQGPPTRARAGASALVATLALGACAPVISHGPRVHDGTAVGVSGAMMSLPDEDEPIAALVPYLTVGNDRGAGNGGRQFTAQWLIPTEAFGGDANLEGSIFGLQGDYYVQAQTDGGRFVRGFGVHASFFELMPYGQWGVYQEGGGVYTTQGFGSYGPWLGLHPQVLFWSPGLGSEYDFDGIIVRASLSTLIGVRTDRMERVDGMPVTFGFAIEMGPRREDGQREGRE